MFDVFAVYYIYCLLVIVECPPAQLLIKRIRIPGTESRAFVFFVFFCWKLECVHASLRGGKHSKHCSPTGSFKGPICCILFIFPPGHRFVCFNDPKVVQICCYMITHLPSDVYITCQSLGPPSKNNMLLKETLAAMTSFQHFTVFSDTLFNHKGSFDCFLIFRPVLVH